MSAVPAVTIWVAYATGWVIMGGALARTPTRPTTWPVLLWCVVAVPSLVQLLWAPGLLEWGQRQSSQLDAGQWWRLGTAIFLQDGGWPGTVFNLAMLAVTLSLVGAVWRGLPTVLVFLLVGVLANGLTHLTTGQTGAGNSMATMGLLAVAVVSVVWARPRSREALAPFAIFAAATIVLLLARDEHGLALSIGLLLGALGTGRRRHHDGAEVGPDSVRS